MSKEKKPFKETDFGKFISKAGKSIPDVLAVGGELLTGDVGGAIDKVGQILKGNATKNEENRKLFLEFEMNKMQFEKDVLELEVRDRESARNREVEVAKTGKKDYMMFITGITGLVSFLALVYVILFKGVPSENEKLVYHLLGVVEGVALTIFAYYFGSSKGSSEKNEMIKK